MAKKRILDLIISSQIRLEGYSKIYRSYMYRMSMAYQLLNQSERTRMIKTNGPAGICGVLLRNQQNGLYQYSFAYCINRKGQKPIGIPDTGAVEEKSLLSLLPDGLEKIHKVVTKHQRPGLIIACRKVDAAEVKRTFELLEYNVRKFGR